MGGDTLKRAVDREKSGIQTRKAGALVWKGLTARMFEERFGGNKCRDLHDA